MTIVKYEKPSMKFVDIRNQHNVAANCWSQDANGRVPYWYYDYDNPDTPGGDGYIKFEMGGNCNRVMGTVIEYYNVPEDEKQKVYEALQTGLSQHEYDPTYIKPEPPQPGEWS